MNLKQRLERIRGPQRWSRWSILLAHHLEKRHQECWEMLLGDFFHSCRECDVSAFSVYNALLLFGVERISLVCHAGAGYLTVVWSTIGFVGIFWSCCVFVQTPLAACECLQPPTALGSYDDRHCGSEEMTEAPGWPTSIWNAFPVLYSYICIYVYITYKISFWSDALYVAEIMLIHLSEPDYIIPPLLVENYVKYQASHMFTARKYICDEIT